MANVLGAFEQAVLLSVLWLGEGAYGRAIVQEVENRLERGVAAGAVQATLARLERKGLLASRLADGSAAGAGRRRRYYMLDESGRRALNEARAVSEWLWRGLVWPLPACG
jgi:DNA-binding PadR family transcriptional regulator